MTDKVKKVLECLPLLVVLVFILTSLVSVIKLRSLHPMSSDVIAGDSEIPVTGSSLIGFGTSGTLNERGSMSESGSKYWWLNSGGMFLVENKVGKTIQGNLPIYSTWRVLYAKNNPTDTDGGYHPQNLFRLVTRSKWFNYTQELTFKVNKDNLSSSPNRNESNGVLLFNRYVDGNNLYYAGVRVDGSAVIKKKLNGTYYTVASKKIFSGTYNKSTSPNLIPKGKIIGIKTEVKNNASGQVEIKLFVKMPDSQDWTLTLSATDKEGSYGGKPISQSAFAGIRTDFMDVEFPLYIITKN